MMRCFSYSALLLLAACSSLREHIGPASNHNAFHQTDQVAEMNAISVDEESTDDEIEDVLLILDELNRNPVKVNAASYEALMQIPAMRPAYARAILRQRERLGGFTTSDQLNSMPGIPLSAWSRIQPYVTLGSHTDLIRDTILQPAFWTAELKVESLSRVRGTLEKADGYRDDLPDRERVYPGPPWERYQRFVVRSRRFSAGTQFRGAPGAIGMTSRPIVEVSHFGLSDLPGFSNVVLGNYKVAYGMGLSMSAGRAPKKGFDATQFRTPKSAISPYSGSSYSIGHTGIGLSFGNAIQTMIWASNRSYTGTIADSNGVRWSVSEPSFRTEEEIGRRDNFSVKLIGARGVIHQKGYHLGIAAWTAATTAHIKPTKTPFGYTGLEGRRFGIISSDFRIEFGGGSMQAEVATDNDAGKAAIVAVESTVFDLLEVSSSVRFYGDRFHSPYGAPLSSWSGRPTNEKGWFSSLNYSPNRRARFMVYHDVYASLRPRSTDFMPTSGTDFGVKLERDFGITQVHSAVRQRSRDEETDATDTFGRIYRKQYSASRTNVKIDMITSLLPRATWVTRAEWVRATTDSSAADNGYLIHQDLSWWISSKTRLQARVTIFNSDSHDSRLYTWEPDVGLASALPSYQGEGSRHYVLVTYKPSQSVDLRLKMARTHMPHQYYIGSGNDRIRDNKRTQINSSLLLRI